MRRRTLVLLGILAVSVAVFVVAARAARPMAEPALGFVAKTVCSDVFVGGFSPAQALGDLPDEPIARLVRTRVDRETGTVTASVPLVARRTAAHRDGLGCTLDAAPAARTARARTRSRERDEWPVPADTAAPIDGALLDSAMTYAFPEPEDMQRRTRAVVVVHDGRIIAERYAPGFGPDSRFTGWSMTKSVISALVGILAGAGSLSIEDPVVRPEWREANDPRARITLRDLLHMSSGLGFDESYTPGGGATRMLFASDDAARVAAQSELVHQPGTRFAYSSATTNIISAHIRDLFASDSAYLSFPQRALFDRVGMRSAVLEPDASGTFVGSSFMYATARDWARFGQLYLQDGVWQGERILPEGWVEFTTTPAPAAGRGEYGAHWWLNAGAAADSTRRMWPRLPRDVYSASGFQGQYVMIVPSRRLVVVRLGVTPEDRAWDMQRFVSLLIQAVTPSSGTE